MAEIEIGLLARGCLDRRIESPCRMRQELETYLGYKNTKPVPIKWQFTHGTLESSFTPFFQQFKVYSTLVISRDTQAILTSGSPETTTLPMVAHSPTSPHLMEQTCM
jgi:hypothetical protein